MSEIAIRLRDVARVFKINQRPFYQIAGLFGLPIPKSSYEEFWAVRDINLDVHRGEKLGIVGRNGAGKSTLLKLISGQLKPTLGHIEVQGKVHALMELGTGFHPEFSGRENALNALAHIGITGKTAQRKLSEIIEFSELEEFIENPLKTYSSGMYARLAFSVATCVEPEILILDEILGAGDAYFTAKAVERMLKLTSGGTTVLFVSHDLASVQRLCTRCLWIERGKIVMDGDVLSVVKAYYADIKKQEELRLKAQNMRLHPQSVVRALQAENAQLIFHFIGDGYRPPQSGLPVHQVRLRNQTKVMEVINVGDAMDNDSQSRGFLFTHPQYINWSPPYQLNGKWVRNFEDRGGLYQHAAGAFVLPLQAVNDDLALEVAYKDILVDRVWVEVYDGENYVCLGALPLEKNQQWRQVRFNIPNNLVCKLLGKPECPGQSAAGHAEPLNIFLPSSVSTQDVYGSREVYITKFEILDGREHECYVLHLGEPLIFRCHYKARDKIESPVFVVAVYRLDGVLATQLISSERGFSIPELAGSGSLDFILDPLLLGEGEYVVSVGIFKRVDLLSRGTENPPYELHDRKYFFKVMQPQNIRVELGAVYHPVRFSHRVYDE